MNAAEIRQEIRDLEAEIARDGTRYDQAFAIGQYELSNNIQIGINQNKSTLHQFYGDLREIRQQAQPVAQPAPFPRNVGAVAAPAPGSQSFSVPSSTSRQDPLRSTDEPGFLPPLSSSNRDGMVVYPRVTASPAPFPPVLTQDSSDFIARVYILENLTHPQDFLERGVRQYFVDQLKGQPVSGSIRRSYNLEIDQHLILRLVGTREKLQEIEVNLLSSVSYWSWCSTQETSLKSLGNQTFTILQSTRGAKDSSQCS